MQIDYVDPLSMNSTTDLTDYNCAGFALKTLDWENMDSFDTSPDDIDLVLSDCEKEILEICPALQRIWSHANVPNDIDVVGFRIAFNEDAEVATNEYGDYEETGTINYECEDFHFVLRTHGQWFHKPGSNAIQEVTFDVDEPWPHGDYPYNSEILWFKRAQKCALFFAPKFQWGKLDNARQCQVFDCLFFQC